jgi:prepilin-type processing-associated H-X9-DG protein
LVELLVVVGLVALLIAILMPALNRARKHAERLKCAANLRTIGQAMTMYTQQYKHYPGCHAAYGVLTTHTFAWPVRLRPFLSSDLRVFHCPSQGDRCEWGEGAPGPVERASGVYVDIGYELGERLITWQCYFSYGYNSRGTNLRGLGDAVDPARKDGTSPPELKASRVRRADDMIAVTDSTADAHFDAIVAPHAGAPYMLPGRVHDGGTNVLFCDGHVTWYPQKDLTLPTGWVWSDVKYAPRARMWNYDHEP